MGVSLVPRTVGDAVAVALRKELLHLWASSDPDSLSAVHTDAIVQAVAPALVDRLLTVAKLRLPGLVADASSLLPEAPARPARAEGVRELADKEDLLDELQGQLGSCDLLEGLTSARERLRRDVAPQVPAAHPWQPWLSGDCALRLPAASVLGLSTAVAPVLLVDVEAHARRPEADADQSFGPDEQVPAGSSQGSGRALRCRRRVFALEKELGIREQASREREAFEREERRKSEARLMEVNLQLQEKLKARTEEARKAGQDMAEAQRVRDEVTSKLQAKAKEVLQLQYKLEKGWTEQRQNEAREHELRRAMLRAAGREAAVKEAARLRSEKLEKCLGGKAVADVLRSAALDVDKTPLLMEKIEAEILDRFKSGKD